MALARQGLAGRGTLGAIVFDRDSGRAMLLGSWHVLAGGPSARQGDAILFAGDPQPAAPLVVGRLARWIIGTVGDAAVAFIEQNLAWDGGTCASVATPLLSERLVKFGCESGLTDAVVTEIGVFRVRHALTDLEMLGFRLDRVPGRSGYAIAKSGDSGSLWRRPGTGEAVGVHVAVGRCPHTGREYAVACTMARVAEALGITVV